MKRILVLYRELAGYFVACLNELCDQHNLNADVVAYPIHKDAPFQFQFSERIRYIDRSALTVESLNSLVADNQYSLIFCGGWSDKMYLQVVSNYRSIPSLLGFDNQWNGSLKQWMACAYARWMITPKFDMAFVPGPEQALFAKRMGFKRVVQGAYSCDVNRYAGIQKQRASGFWSNNQKKLFFVGRYAPEKFIKELQEVFIELQTSEGRNWKLICAGVGPLWSQRMEHPAIEHLGFTQPDQLLENMYGAHAFVLPSTFEPWGVVAHEFAAAGVPLLLSDAVGARNAFLEIEKNGFEFQSGNRNALKSALIAMFKQDPEGLNRMSEHSYYLAHKITPATWSQSVFQLLKP